MIYYLHGKNFPLVVPCELPDLEDLAVAALPQDFPQLKVLWGGRTTLRAQVHCLIIQLQGLYSRSPDNGLNI